MSHPRWTATCFVLLIITAASAHHGEGPHRSTCIVGAKGCSTGSRCTQTTPCGGLCLTTAANVGPPTKACVLGDQVCPTGAVCTQTSTCRGTCTRIVTSTSTTSTTAIPCILGAFPDVCAPAGLTCSQTMTCGGLCYTTASVDGGASVITGTSTSSSTAVPTQTCVLGGKACGSGAFCYRTKMCSGLCVSPSPATTV